MCNLHDLAFEHTERGRIRQHDAGGCRTHRRLQRLDIHVAIGIAGNLLDDESAHGRGCRVGAVRRLRHDDFGACRITARSVVGTDHRHAGKLALRAGHRRETDGRHPRDLLQHLLQLMHARQKPLRLRPQRMSAQELRQHRVSVAGLRVVLHRAGTQGIEMRVDGEIHLRQAGEMTHRLQF
jgi:hypothetical protein